MRFEKLTEPGQIGKIKTKNRMVKPAQSMHFATDDGYVSDTNLAFYETVARGGLGLIFVEMAAIDYPGGHPSLKDLLIHEDIFIPRLSELAEIIHRYDVPAFLQLTHCGPTHDPIEGSKPRAPVSMSEEELPRKGSGPTVGLTIPEIEDLVDKFAKGAERAKKAGFDGVEIHGAHGYLIASFLSNIWNKRDDRYGGSLENRARFACEVIRAIKERVGEDFPVGMRINGAEYGMENGLTVKDSQAISRMLEESGADCIHVSAYGYGPQYNRIVNPEQVFYPEAPEPLGEGLDGSRKGAGALTLLAAEVKKVVSIPVITVGRLDPVLAEKVLKEGRADHVALGRCLMADPEAALKIMEGRAEEIAPCTACVMCLDNYFSGRPVSCRVNATIGKEREYEIKAAEKKKKVMVVGGGPAGMEAARIAAKRGHEVSLYERGHTLGGSIPVLALIKGLDVEDLLGLMRYFRVQLSKYGVKVNLGKEVDEALVKEIKPDVIILATGGTTAVPEIPGIDKSIVMSQSRLREKVKPYLRFLGPKLLRSLTKYYLPVGKKVVIIGGGIQGVQLAEFLIKRGRKVTITEMSDKIGDEVPGITLVRLLPWLDKQGCAMLSDVKYKEITDKGLTIINKEGKEQTIEADTVLPALRLILQMRMPHPHRHVVRHQLALGRVFQEYPPQLRVRIELAKHIPARKMKEPRDRAHGLALRALAGTRRAEHQYGRISVGHNGSLLRC